MEHPGNEMEPAESLQLIIEVIGKTRENIKEHGYLFMLWGWLIACASILFFLLHTYTSFKLYFLPFPVLALAGIVLTILYWSKKAASSETYIGFFLRNLWIVLGLSFIVVVFINVSRGNLPFTYTMILAGIGTLSSGLVLRFGPLKIGGALFLLLAIVSVYVAETYAPLLQGVAVIAGYLVPGYLLNHSKA